MTTLEQNNTIKICIIGLGYVGLPLAIEFSKRYSVIGLDKDADRIKQLNAGIDKTLEVNKEELNVADIIYTVEAQDISDCNVYIITVPTPVDQYNNPDLFPLNSASKMVGSILNTNDIVIYESTVYPGCTEEDCV
jgi:UDP-N-acetyl-D-galactosamine dehydrogenase